MPINKILLVDDSAPFNFLSRVIMKENDLYCQVDEALNGKQALEYLAASNECPDIILLDIRMPVMDGFEFLEEYRHLVKCHNHTKIFILSSSTRAQDVEAANANPLVTGYLDKPLNDEHVEMLKKLFEH